MKDYKLNKGIYAPPIHCVCPNRATPPSCPLPLRVCRRNCRHMTTLSSWSSCMMTHPHREGLFSSEKSLRSLISFVSCFLTDWWGNLMNLYVVSNGSQKRSEIVYDPDWSSCHIRCTVDWVRQVWRWSPKGSKWKVRKGNGSGGPTTVTRSRVHPLGWRMWLAFCRWWRYHVRCRVLKILLNTWFFHRLQ